MLTSVEGLIIYVNDFGWETAYCKLFFVWLFLCFLIFVAVLDLFIFHIEILLKGITTLENKSVNMTSANKQCSSAMEESYGENCCCWICPKSKFY